MTALAWGLPAAWFVTFAVHSTVLLGVVWVLCRLRHSLSDSIQETLWRVAAVGAVVTASLQTALVSEPLGGHLAAVPVAEPAAHPNPEAVENLAVLPLPLSTAATPAFEIDASWTTWPWPLIGLGAAALVGLLAVLRLLLLHRRLRRVLADRQPLHDPDLTYCLEQWRCAAGMRRARLTTSEALTTPVAFGVLRPEICLPSRAADLDPAHQRAVVAHELAHLRRRDPLWLGLTGLLRALFWWQPLYRLAHVRLQALAEFRSDALAVTWTGGAPLAGALVEVAAWLRPGHELQLVVPAMAVRASVLRARVERILAGSREASRVRSRLVLPAAVVVLAGLTAALPGARWREEPASAPVDVPTSGEERRAAPSPMQELVAAFDEERRFLGSELRGLRGELAGLPADHELRALMTRLEERVARMDRTRKALGVFLAAMEEEATSRSRGAR